MSIDPNTLPDGAVVEIERCVFAIREDGQISSGFVGGVPFMPTKPITRVFVPVPDGMTLADAEAALADAGAWVEVDNITDDLPIGTRVRTQWNRWQPETNRTYVHRDDLPPTDPDADLIEAMARAAYATLIGPGMTWDERGDMIREQGRKEARAALAVVREHEATR